MVKLHTSDLSLMKLKIHKDILNIANDISSDHLATRSHLLNLQRGGPQYLHLLNFKVKNLFYLEHSFPLNWNKNDNSPPTFMRPIKLDTWSSESSYLICLRKCLMWRCCQRNDIVFAQFHLINSNRERAVYSFRHNFCFWLIFKNII